MEVAVWFVDRHKLEVVDLVLGSNLAVAVYKMDGNWAAVCYSSVCKMAFDLVEDKSGG